MPSTPVYQLPYPAPTDPADVPLDLQKLASQVALVLGGALSATPPATPIDGQLWAMSPAAGVVWVFRYNPASASAYKWEFVGGGSLESEFAGEQLFGTSGVWNPTTAAVTVPRAGEYDISFGALLRPDNPWYNLVAPKIGAAAVADANAAVTWNGSTSVPSAGYGFTVARTIKLPAVAGDAIALYYRSEGGVARASRNWIAVRPYRVS